MQLRAWRTHTQPPQLPYDRVSVHWSFHHITVHTLHFSLTFDHVGTALMSHNMGDVSCNGPFFTCRGEIGLRILDYRHSLRLIEELIIAPC